MFNIYFQPSFLLLLQLLSVNTEVPVDIYNQQSTALDNADLTKNFTNMELELALSDLSLKDLRVLQKFIDSADVKDIDYDDNLMEKNIAEYMASDADNENIFDDMNFEPEDDINYDQKPIVNFYKQANENPRTKRKDNLIDEEYIKQLDFSFPQNVKQNNIAMELKKEHIRVKRNSM